MTLAANHLEIELFQYLTRSPGPYEDSPGAMPA
eukprot:CAMPEP_0175590576 /NCGR_PEP_ID=MMETSP0096-20121207/52411_1 /TAXON_ID=311494 /ORGANISM="Alexandrium monilatum, Strain CCMP3105" /LENGTH=32 /DNA_ID= /DNA_START= /DNA_END= /DNA_ORIENTATION=